MVGMRVPPVLTKEDAKSYIIAVNERFHDEPAKFEEFLKVLDGPKNHRPDRDSVIAQVKELLKDHHDLLLGFNVFLSAEAKIVIPPEAKKAEQLAKSADTGLSQIQTMVGMRVPPPLTEYNAHSYLVAVYETFRDEPTKFEEFLKLLNGLRDHRPDRDSVIAQVKELLKDHHDLLLGFNVFLPAKAKIAIPPEAKKAEQLIAIPPEAKKAEQLAIIPPEAKKAEQLIAIPPEAKQAEQLGKSADTEKKHADAEDFMNKLKTRFRTLDTHVVGSFKAIMRMFKEGKMSVKEVHKEVTDILYYHDDLIKDFLRFFEKNDPIASASLLLES